METHFASPQRSPGSDMLEELDLVAQHPMLNTIMEASGSLVAIVNENRQIVTVNFTFLELLGVSDPHKILGLRPGEALQCIHAHEMSAGCGTSEFCSTCGAAIAIVTSLATNEIVERNCVLEVVKDGEPDDLYLSVKASPLKFDHHRFILLFIEDITLEQQWAAMERVFFHDINNIINALLLSINLIEADSKSTDLKKCTKLVKHLAKRLSKEIAIQKALSKTKNINYSVELTSCWLPGIVEELHGVFSTHKAASNKRLEIMTQCPECSITTDHCLLLRVLLNILVNAFEATDNEGVVKLWIEKESDHLLFKVWNHQSISPKVAKRIFQRNFSTKGGAGRGLGTYSMKYFSRYINGQVSFSSSPEEGTVFRLKLPLNQQETIMA